MSSEKKRVKSKPLKKAGPKQRPAGSKIKPVKVKEKPKQTKSDIPETRKFMRVPCGDKDKFVSVGERVFNGEMVWSHFCIENENGVHYYLIK